MTVDVHLHHHFDTSADVTAKLDQILALLGHLTAQGATVMAELDVLTTKVAETTTIEQSAITLIQGLAAQLAAAQHDPAAIQALADQLSAQSTALAAAIAANTPAA